MTATCRREVARKQFLSVFCCVIFEKLHVISKRVRRRGILLPRKKSITHSIGKRRQILNYMLSINL